MGADVTCLQAGLIAAGYSIPAGATGFYGEQTEAAVTEWQGANGLPATGYFGALSRAKWSLSVGAVAVPGCTPGASFSVTTGMPCSGNVVEGCQPGYLFSTTTGKPCNGTSIPGCFAGAAFSITTGQACRMGS
jgi:peptidoglycan hydrolase-like protein with peptidoglycan-binding domain